MTNIGFSPGVSAGPVEAGWLGHKKEVSRGYPGTSFVLYKNSGYAGS